MNKLNSDTAVLIFALSSEAEKIRKPFFALERLGDSLQEDTLKKVKDAGLDYYHFDEKLQQGDTFGERISEAAQTVFNKGYKQLIIIGNDTPGLTSRMLKEASVTLRNKKSIAGLSRDGGLYLIGLIRKFFDKKDFKNLAWKTKKLSTTFLENLCSNNVSTVCLPVLSDIDNFQDLFKIQYERLDSILECIQRILKQLRDLKRTTYSKNTLFIRLIYQAILGTRGSPFTFYIR